MKCNGCLTRTIKWYWLIAILLFSGFIYHPNVEAAQFTINVVDSEGNPITTGFRWLVEEDLTYPVAPGVLATDTLAVQFHNSHAPVKTKGEITGSTTTVKKIQNNQRYFVSVLPYSGYAMSGAPRAARQSEVTVVVNEFPIPTAQISVFVFEDNKPINNAPDLPQEEGLGDFAIKVFDAAGMYGIAGGQVMQDAFGNPLGPNGDGIIETDENGFAVIKNLAPGKYGIQVVPPAGQGWIQTTTIEGSKTIDAWVKANEPQFFVEFGPPGPHVFVGFVRPIFDTSALTGSATITGQVVNMHASRPPNFTFYNGQPFPSCWIGLNDLAVGEGKGIYAQPCNDDSIFSIPNVPPGQYQLVVWDKNLDIIIAFLGVTVQAGVTEIDLIEVPVFNWFSRMEHYVFLDLNENGIRDTGEIGIPEQNINLRFRDGRLYQSFPTDLEGYAPFDEVFPFFHWLVAEVDFARFKATGATITVDAGGPIDPTDPFSFGAVLNPQPQYENSDLPYRTETGPVLTQAFQGFLGQTNVIEWGKVAYGPGENGGISGIVYYATTRAENDLRFAVGEEWEPGIPRVQINLYQDSDMDRIIDDLDFDGEITLADVDNYPFDNFPGREDIDRNGNDIPDLGDALDITWTDSWDDNIPTGCQGNIYIVDGVMPTDCFDGLRNFNQVRPGVFDGGYAFDGLPSGIYIIEAALPSGYEHVKEEDRNVDFGDQLTPSPQLLPPFCVGDLRTVPDYFSFVTDENGNLLPGYDPAESAAPFAGETRPLCDRKHVTLTSGKNAAIDFFMFTQTPKAAHVIGGILNDLANEFDPNSPTFGEKFAPPFLPVAFYDWAGNEITRVYGDRWGKFNAMLPSTYTVNLPMPSGVSPNMLTACMNDAGTVPNPDFNPSDPNSSPTIIDPFFDRRYSQFCYTFQYMPGSTTYLDTPVVPIAAFTGTDKNPLDCEHSDETPLIYSVSGPDGGPYAEPGDELTIISTGKLRVPNPAYDGINDLKRTIKRDYRFGNRKGTVTIAGESLDIVSWKQGKIRAIVPAGTPTGQLIVTHRNGEQSPVDVTVTVGPLNPGRNIHQVSPGTPGSTPIQDAIDAAASGDLILVAPGSYNELVIMYKPVQLQGWGAWSVIINARKVPGEKLQVWRDKIKQLYDDGAFDILPGQEVAFGNLEPDLFFAEEGAGIVVVAKETGPNQFLGLPNARIDGFTVIGADHGGGIFASGYADYLEISNNRVISNQGTFGGGIRIGHPNLTNEVNGVLEHTDGDNDNITIHHNHVAQNGNLGGAGAGVSLYTGTDQYKVTENFICGNFSQEQGAGIGHLGLSRNGLIADNTIIFNQSFNQGQPTSGGGIFIGGAAAGLGGPGSMSPGSGTIKVVGNLIQGNHAGAGDGGGIYTAFVNGQDVADNPDTQEQWYKIDIINNIIVNNVAGFAGGGIAMQDTARINIINNTIANNDSTATVSEAFIPNNPNETIPQPAGVVSRGHSTALVQQLNGNVPNRFKEPFSNPMMENNIIWHNRSFYWRVDDTTEPSTFGLLPDVGAGQAPVYNDLAVLLSTLGSLDPKMSILTDTTGYHSSNITGDPLFVDEYVNGDRGQTILIPELTTSIAVAPAFDEGGNFIDVIFGPLTLTGDYHIQGGSPAIDAGNTNIIFQSQISELTMDFDKESRPQGSDADIGADEVQ